ncbi:hypothetical protein PDTA9759_36130 [Phytobacter diazotrophicus]|uniref:Uncharacterized protein n=1 Tax=Phytobacter diazotrophicus TaxID=395631 RepID=A0ABM7VXX0_9ENTR|nr:hypothetical protein PDTA9734_36170 [Phytobacter diazotrophicus]BEG83059.1 hypothetical protein PDTA9730_35150 [Phytobacter diazotrophicus]BEG88957.1 hypothetical protein PDTA9759_36130 [Phytobacter diazotrophicus]BEG94721.1 hypothetical protein PDTA9832_35800 [Phytobacter diazotrophicus]SLJ96536.1 hypothetical protein SAMN03159434_102546 [Enterobacter sp. NFR05]
MPPFFFSETPHPTTRSSLNFFTFGKANAFLSLYTDRKSIVSVMKKQGARDVA